MQKRKYEGKQQFSGYFPMALYQRLKATAQREHRPIIGQLTVILERYFAQEDASGNAA